MGSSRLPPNHKTLFQRMRDDRAAKKASRNTNAVLEAQTLCRPMLPTARMLPNVVHDGLFKELASDDSDSEDEEVVVANPVCSLRRACGDATCQHKHSQCNGSQRSTETGDNSVDVNKRKMHMRLPHLHRPPTSHPHQLSRPRPILQGLPLNIRLHIPQPRQLPLPRPVLKGLPLKMRPHLPRPLQRQHIHMTISFQNSDRLSMR